MIELDIKQLSWSTQGIGILNDINLNFRQGELIAMLGPNGAGKTSLLRCALGIETRYDGDIRLAGKKPHEHSAQERARLVSYLPQIRPMAWPITVEDTVALGRFSHGVSLGKLRGRDKTEVFDAIAACDITHLIHRRVDTLSGGELARVHCARAFAARAPLLIADEPIAALDPKHQYTVMALIREYVNAGNGALIVLHDVELAARFADRLLWLQDGHVVADGPPRQTLTQQRMAEVYGVNTHIGEIDHHQTVSILGTID